MSRLQVYQRRMPSPWIIGLHKDHTQRKLEEEEVQIRRSFKHYKRNPKYAHISLLEESNLQEPTIFDEAAKSSDWRKTMEEEIQTLKAIKTSELVPRPTHEKSIPSQWV